MHFAQIRLLLFELDLRMLFSAIPHLTIFCALKHKRQKSYLVVFGPAKYGQVVYPWKGAPSGLLIESDILHPLQLKVLSYDSSLRGIYERICIEKDISIDHFLSYQ